MADSAVAKVVQFVAPRRVEVRTVNVEPKPGEELVTSTVIGISHGTELLAYRGELPEGMEADETLASLAGDLAYPITYGYMNVGAAADGTRVFAFVPHQDRFPCRPEEWIPLPNTVSNEDGVFLPTMETAVGIVQDLRPVLGETVLVTGLGVVGLLVVELLARSGVDRVIACDPIHWRRALAEQAGCDVVDPADAGVERIAALTCGRGPDCAVNASGSAEGLQLAIDTVAREGTVVEASWYGRRAATLCLGTRFHRHRLTVRSSQVSHINPALTPRWTKPRRIETVLRLLAEVKPSRFITHRFPLEQASEAYRLIDSHGDEVVQVVLDPRA
jgi:threonine dehydrogenase-like Zn-dependent dehydrogenase